MWQDPSKSARLLTISCWLFWAAALATGLYASSASSSWVSSYHTEFKTLSSLSLVTYAWLSALRLPQQARQSAVLVATGMSLGSLGDASPLLGNLWPDPQRTLTNMLLFGAGHVCYIRACLLANRHVPKRPGTSSGLRASIACWLAIGTIAWYFAAWLGNNHLELRIPALGYTLLLATTTGVAFGLAIGHWKFVAVAIGAILFLTSDLLLAVWIFHDVVYRPFDLVWLSYGLGQMLIVFGAMSVVRHNEQ